MDIASYQTESGYTSNAPCWWNYDFPCGRSATVSLSKTPHHFDVEIDPEDADHPMIVHTAVTTTKVDELLTGLAAESAGVTA
ncbi:MAG TPA: hypothetical protein VI172_14765 [Candidatus Dormibacteraeota bacterium]|jgi:hypothetical protein